MNTPLLRYHALWLGIGYCLIMLVVGFSLMPAPPLPDLPSVPSDKIGHVLGYFGLMAWFGQLYPRPRHPRLALIFSALGMILEILQGLSGYRSFDYFDMLANLCGVLLGWLFAYSAFGKTLAAIEQRLYPAD